MQTITPSEMSADELFRANGEYVSIDHVRTLIDAVWQALDDMGARRCCMSPAAKAELRLAYAPFDDGDGPLAYTLADAEQDKP